MSEQKSLTRSGSSIPPDCTLEHLLAITQALLMHAPYSRQLRLAKRFALKHPDAAFREAMLAKLDLFDRQQRELRPNCALSRIAYTMERLIGYSLSSRLVFISFGVLLFGAAMAVYQNPRYLQFEWLPRPTYEFNKKHEEIDSLLESYLLRIDPSNRSQEESRLKSTASDATFESHLLEALKNPEIMRAIKSTLSVQVGEAISPEDSSELESVKEDGETN